MEDQNSVTVTIPAVMEDVLSAYMAAARTATAGEFLRVAVNHSLEQEERPALTSNSCSVIDNYLTRLKGGEITIVLEFKGDAANLLENKILDEDDSPWVVASMYEDMEALTPTLPRDTLIKHFSMGMGGVPDGRPN